MRQYIVDAFTKEIFHGKTAAVCGSAHCNLIPYWSKRLGKDKMIAFQASPRGGIVYCENKGERVIISGNAALYSESEINIR